MRGNDLWRERDEGGWVEEEEGRQKITKYSDVCSSAGNLFDFELIAMRKR